MVELLIGKSLIDECRLERMEPPPLVLMMKCAARTVRMV
jgi:hypothetical protein